MAWSDSVFIPRVAPVGVSMMDKWLFDVESFMNFEPNVNFIREILDFDEDFET